MNINTEQRFWENKYKINEPTIDSQHYQLFHKIDRLFYFVNNGNPEKQKQECMKIIDFLMDYTLQHFSTEEAYQRKINYCDYERHKKMHDQFTKVINSYHKQLLNNFSQKTLEAFFGTLLVWLTNHVYIYDRKIITNEKIFDSIQFDNSEAFLKKFAKKVLTDIYEIKVLSVNPCIYNGFIDRKVFIRTIVKDEDKQHIFICSMSEKFAKAIFNKASSFKLDSIDDLGEFELSCFEEIAATMSEYAAELVSKSNFWDKFDSKVFIGSYDDKDNKYDFSDNCIVEVKTEFGNMEILYLNSLKEIT